MSAMTLREFLIRMGAVAVPALLAFLWVGIRSIHKKGWTFSGVNLESKAIIDGTKSIHDFQDGNWMANVSQVHAFSGTTVSTLLLAVTFVLQLQLDYWRALLIDIIILTVGLSCLLYTFSLQFWNQALDRCPDIRWLLRQRKVATMLQALGWHGLYLSVMLCVSLINFICGIILGIIGSIGIIVIYEYKVSALSPAASAIAQEKVEKRDQATAA